MDVEFESSRTSFRECGDCLLRPNRTCGSSPTARQNESHTDSLQVVTTSNDESDQNSQQPANTHTMDLERSVTEGQSMSHNESRQQDATDRTERTENNHLPAQGMVVGDDDETETNTSDRERRKRKKGALMCISLTRLVALVILAIVIAGLFTVPIVLFILKANDNNASMVPECYAEVYTGEACQSVLAARQSCIPGRENSTEVSVSLTQSLQGLVEEQLVGLLTLITPSPDCESELQSFLCVEAFAGFCDSTGTVHRTTRQECERLTNTVCAAEVQLILPLLEANGFKLSCDTFPDSSSICSNMSIQREGAGSDMLIPSYQQISLGSGGNNTVGLAPDRNCSEGFFVDETSELRLCKPECGEWWPQSENQMEVLTIVTLTSGAVGVTFCLIVLILYCIHYKTAFTFPGIFIFYQMLSSLVYSIVFVISYVDFKALLCGSRDLVESFMPGNETPWCTITAAAWIYISHQVALWWIFHLSMVFCTVFWPFKYHYWKHSGYFKYIHIVMVAVALIVPIIPVVICYKTGGYVLYFLIRPDCVARNTQAAFYSHVVPLIAAVAIGLYLLVLIFWKFFSEEWMCPQQQGFTKRQVEIKILLLLCCYIIIWTDVFAVLVATVIEAEAYRNTLTEYFTCEVAGTEECSRGGFEQFDVPSKTIAYALIGLYPAIFLIYFVSVKKSLCINICRRSRIAANSTGTSASVLSRN